MSVARVYVGIGSNIERERHIRAAVAGLRERFGELDLSRVYQSRAVGFDGDDFYNMVAGFEARDDVHQVAVALQQIEDANGRRRDGPRFSSRTLDIDLLLYDDLIINDGQLQLPRDEILQNSFVLLPLAEIAPRRIHPVTGKALAEHARAMLSGDALVPVEIDLSSA